MITGVNVAFISVLLCALSHDCSMHACLVGIAFCDNLDEILKYIGNSATQDYIIQKYIGTICSIDLIFFFFQGEASARLLACPVQRSSVTVRRRAVCLFKAWELREVFVNVLQWHFDWYWVSVRWCIFHCNGNCRLCCKDLSSIEGILKKPHTVLLVIWNG